MKILIVEDTRELGASLVRYLAVKNISAELVLDGVEWLYRASTQYYDVIILDINLPGKDGLEICRELRLKEKSVPIIMLTSRSWKDDIITGLEAWADDYLVKPFDYGILLARLEALARRNLKNKSTEILRAWNFTLNLETLSVENISGENIHLSHLEFQLLKYFAQNKGRVIARQELYEKVWGEFEGHMMFSKTIDVYIGYLRKKLWSDIVETKKGFGYMMK